MARPKNSVPKYTLHKQTGQARIWLNGRNVYLGAYDSPDSHREYARIVAELAAAPVDFSTPVSRSGPTVDEVLLAFWRWAETHYRRPDGTSTNQITELKCSLKPLHELYGHTPARDFGPLALKAVREEMVRLDWCRNQVNARVGKVKRVFKWAASEELIPVTVSTALATVAGLQKGRTPARETEPVTPVPEAHVEATLPHLGEHVRGLVTLQRLTGCRPGEACAVRRCDIDTTGNIWVWNLGEHKTAYHGKLRPIPIGPRAQELLKSFFVDDPAAHLFDPRTERSNAGARYTTHSYCNAVRRAAKKAGVPHWHPNQLRHTFATEVRRGHGVEAAQVLLGHSRADVTQLYAERNQALAEKIATEIG